VTATDSLAKLHAALRAAPWAYDYYALLRRIEALTPRLPRWGTAARPSQEPLRLGAAPELDFAPAALAQFANDESGLPRLDVRFFGLLGPNGPLPLHLTEYVRERYRNHADPTLKRFLDVFHHRMLALIYRAWAQAQPVSQRDRPTDDRYAAWLGAGFGLGAGNARQDSLPDVAKLHQAGLLASRSRHPEGLAKLLALYFGVPVRVREHQPHWMSIAAEDRSRLGFARNRAERPGARAASLGRDAAAGSRVWDRQYKFRIELGPLTMSQYESFLPGGSAANALRDWVRLYAGPDMSWDLELVLRHAEVPPPRLGRHLRLGWTSWVAQRRGRPPCDRRDLHLKPGVLPPPIPTGAPHG
jgi:type VI secretion system protein ImpH